jgi:dUTP pyrophosphatase
MSNSMKTLRIAKTSPDAKAPVRAHHDDAGLDLCALEDAILGPGQGKTVRTGITIELETGFFGMIADRSSMAKKGVKTAGGIVDSGYRGEIQVVLWNLSQEEIRIARGDKMAQLLVLPIALPQVELVESLTQTERGAKGFGSSGL